MANPQKENGYTAIANEIMDALISTDLSGQDFKVALLIIRKTYGFNKIEDAVSLTQMMNATGMSKIRCSQVVNRLELMKILTVTQNINGIGKKYKFNKDFENWITVKENINRYKKTKQTVKVLRNIPLRKTLTTKDNITKDNIQKTRSASEFEIFWKHYPNKKEKTHALKCWKKINGTRPPIEKLLEAIRKQIEWRNNANGEFRPEWKNPATWLNKGCWDDELKREGTAGTVTIQKEYVPEPYELPTDDQIKRNIERANEIVKKLTG
ncbi:MAG TPA: replication protein [Bacteroidales bacterium]|nr:replication protein [Bacteroidales bacterium]